MQETIHFNTNCLYTVHGQRISAHRNEWGDVTFNDHDRGIIGEFSNTCDLPKLTQEWVMQEYLHNRYVCTDVAMHDATCKNGPNTEYKGPALKHR